ncbi:hypothetical protein BRADI_2g09243v3 [Brachypodium distachyon]|uniref:Uncharacterized protein n=1 Tax=Brachypodium distachyon TaxID=15368 RepID=A0A2K2D7M5_BRADI|nr:hypothetical protein BRADI_2g09243v3 [Brachypodium distachyon]
MGEHSHISLELDEVAVMRLTKLPIKEVVRLQDEDDLTMLALSEQCSGQSDG